MILDDFEGFVRRNQDMVYTTALRLLSRDDEARDIGQDTFLKAFERREELASHANPGAWLRTVATNLCLNHLQRHRRRWSLFSELEEEDGSSFERTLAEPPGREDDRAELLERALLALPDNQRVPIVLFHFEDMGYEEISRRLGASLGKIKTDIFRGRRALRAALGEEGQ